MGVLMISGVRSLCVGALVAATPASALTGQTAGALILSPGTPVVHEYEFGMPGPGAISPRGDLYIADDLNTEILKISPDGNLLWKVGRKGSGPGEYRHPYRLAARGDSGIAVLDWGSGRVTLLSASGEVDAVYTLPFPFTQLDGFERLSDGRFVIAGMTTTMPALRGSLHVFSDSLRHLYSFGPWAEAADSAVVLYAGSGGISIDHRGHLIFTRKRPYEIQMFDVSGRRLGVAHVSTPIAFGLDDLIELKVFNGSSFRGLTPKSMEVEIPSPAVSLGAQGFLSGRSTFTTARVDLVSRSGTLIDSELLPNCDLIVAVDPQRRVIYCRTMRDDIPGLMRIPYAIAGAVGR
jgi:hypothetical protein